MRRHKTETDYNNTAPQALRIVQPLHGVVQHPQRRHLQHGMSAPFRAELITPWRTHLVHGRQHPQHRLLPAAAL